MKLEINDAIARADELRLNAISDEQKYRWVYELECSVREMMGEESLQKTFPENFELAMPEEHANVYVKYLAAKIDYYNGEMSLYANDMAIYNEAMDAARAWLIRNRRPASGSKWKVW